MSRLRSLVGEEEEEDTDLVALVEEAKRLIVEEEQNLMLEKKVQSIEIKDENVELLVAKLDQG